MAISNGVGAGVILSVMGGGVFTNVLAAPNAWPTEVLAPLFVCAGQTFSIQLQTGCSCRHWGDALWSLWASRVATGFVGLSALTTSNFRCSICIGTRRRHGLKSRVESCQDRVLRAPRCAARRSLLHPAFVACSHLCVFPLQSHPRLNSTGMAGWANQDEDRADEGVMRSKIDAVRRGLMSLVGTASLSNVLGQASSLVRRCAHRSPSRCPPL